MPAIARLALVLALPLLAGRALAAEKPSPFPATARYQAALRDARARAHPDVEALFRLAAASGREIEAALDQADEQGRALDPMKVNGLVISVYEVLYAVPDPRFFADLAKKGRPVDRAFFELLAATRPDGVWPVYLEQQTDATGCVRFDLPELPALYGRWLDFRRQHPDAYAEAVARELAEVDGYLSQNECACGSREATLAGLEAFARALPDAPITAKVKARLEDLRAGKAELRGDCHSG